MLAPAWAAGSERYDYDGLGRLVRVISGDGTVTEYTYDPAGNITAVTRGAAAQPPTLGGASPSALRRGSQVRVLLTGTNLGNVALRADDRELTISRVTRTAGSIEFDLAASAQATLGSSSLRVSSAAGTATLAITVRPKLPTVEVTPLPIAVPPDGRSATITLTLSNTDDQAHTVALSTLRSEVARVSPASVTVAAGSTRAIFQVTGVAAGNTELRLDSSTLGNAAFPIFVLQQFEGINTARAPLVGVTLAAPPQPPTGFPGVFAAVPVGVVRADLAWIDTSPRFVAQGSTQVLRIEGRGLGGGWTLGAAPPDGLSFATPVPSADGRSATVNVTASASAARGLRRLQLQSAGLAVVPVVAGADLLDVVAPLPVVTSVDPIVLVPGSTVATFKIRGRNLQDATAVQVQGGGITVGSSLSASIDGTLLEVGLQVSPLASAGPRTVVVQAPAGSSSAVATASNTVTVVNDVTDVQPFGDLQAPRVGVVKAPAAPPPAEATYDLGARVVGVVLGPVAVTSSPASIARTETLTLRVLGQYLQGVTAVSIVPATGLTVSTATVNASGTEVAVQVSATGDAPLGGRRVEILAGTAPVRVAGSGALSLLVTPLTPIVESVDPNSVVPSGLPFELVVRGRNFLGATSVRITPATGVSIGTVAVNGEGTEVRVPVSVATSAARGPRTVTVVAPAGESTSAPGPNNQLTLSNGIAVFDLPAAPVGVQVGTPPPPPQPPPIEAWITAPLVGVALGPLGNAGPGTTLYSPSVGVTLASPPVQSTRDLEAVSAPAGVSRGPVVLRLDPDAWVPGASGTLVVRGQRLVAGSTLQFVPPDGVTLSGSATVDADGRALRQPITVAAGTSAASLAVHVVGPAGAIVPVAGGASESRTLWLLGGPPEIVSLGTIVARQGDTVDLEIRGLQLGAAQRVTAEPPEGIDFASDFTVNAAGTVLTIKLRVRDDASRGLRVIRVFNRLGGSSAVGGPPNHFEIFLKD